MPVRGQPVRGLAEDSADDFSRLSPHLQKKFERRRKSLHRLGGLYGLNPSADRQKFPFPFKRKANQQLDSFKGRYDSPNAAKGSRKQRHSSSAKNLNPRWNFGTHPSSVCGHGTAWRSTLNYLTDEELHYLEQNRTFVHGSEVLPSQCKHRSAPLDPHSHFLLPKTATNGNRCQYCIETGRIAPLEKKLVNAKPNRMVAGQQMKESRSDTSFLFHATLVCNRQLSPRSLKERLDAPGRERARRMAQRDPCCERLRVHPIFKSVTLDHVRKVMQRSAADDHNVGDGDEEVMVAENVNRFQFMRAMSYLGFAHSDGKLLSRLYSSFDCDANDSISINDFVEHFQKIALKQQTVNFAPATSST